MPINVQKCGGEMFVGSETMHRAAFCVVSDLTPLYIPTAYRGGSLVIPTLAGVQPRRKRHDANEHTLDLVIVGDIDPTGTTYEDPEEGFDETLSWMETNIYGIPSYGSNPNTVRPVTVVFKNGETRSGDAQFAPPVLGETTIGYDQTGTWTKGSLATMSVTFTSGPLA